MAEGRIEGVVVDSHGRPLADCTVMLTGASPEHRDLAALTADDGSFSFLELEPGHYEILAQSESGASRTKGVDVDAVDTSSLEIRLPTS